MSEQLKRKYKNYQLCQLQLALVLFFRVGCELFMFSRRSSRNEEENHIWEFHVHKKIISAAERRKKSQRVSIIHAGGFRILVEYDD